MWTLEHAPDDPNRCVIKLSKLTKAGKVWRGIKDAVLPKVRGRRIATDDR